MSDYENTKYHAHITLTSNSEVPKGWKKTNIILIGNRVQEDIMITKHYQIGKKDFGLMLISIWIV